MLDVILNNQAAGTGRKQLSKPAGESDKPIKSFIKSLSWRIVGTLDTIIISYFITGKLSFAVSIGSIEVITKTVLYYFHERLWAHIHGIKINILKKKTADQKNEHTRTERITGREVNRGCIKNPDFTLRRANAFYNQFWN
ncbi:MAG: DUF2061 domain-containing protein [Bacteroidales bacterium]|nr:DUF2061 domain-containing protein [Bacteroidales bacterium]MBN2633310.1 DUF2061 domain-containing protein [Bacteroidales bacterium]